MSSKPSSPEKPVRMIQAETPRDIDGLGEESEVLQGRQIGTGEPLQQFARTGPLHGDERHLTGLADDDDVEVRDNGSDRRIEVVGVRHDPEMLIRVLVDGAVVGHCAIGVDEGAIPHLANGERLQVIGEDPLYGPHGVLARDIPLLQGVDVPQANRGADGAVLRVRVTEVGGP